MITATRNHPYLDRGASPRGTIALVKMAKAAAWAHGREFVMPQDVKEQFPYVVTHRMIFNMAGTAAVCCTLQWYVYVHKKKWFPFLFMVLFLMIGLSAFVMRDTLSEQFRQMLLRIQGKAEAVSAMEAEMFMAASLSLCLFLIEILFGNHSLLYVFVWIIFLGAPFLGVQVGMKPLALFVFFQISFLVLYLPGKGMAAVIALSAVCFSFPFLWLPVMRGICMIWFLRWRDGFIVRQAQ